MVVFPNAKINIGLFVTRKRVDGFHDLETIFYPIGLSDVLEITEEPAVRGTCIFKNTGIDIACPLEKNLVVRAYQLLANRYDLPAVRVHLHKVIPFGAGLGGGSSDAAFTIKVLNEKYNLNITEKQQKEYASKLGADCAFFISNKPSYATGIGNILKDINLSLSNYYIYLIKPNIHISTAEAYSSIIPQKNEVSLQDIILKTPIEEWKNYIFNDFEKSIFKQHQEIKELKETLYKQGALYASMSGSGSSVFGIFKHKPIPFHIPQEWFSFIDILK